MMKWLKVNSVFVIILLLIAVITLVISDIYIHSDKSFDDVRFNNIVTPLAAIISVVLFSYLTFRQIRIQESSNLKANYEEVFQNLELDLEKFISDRVTGIIGQGVYEFTDINSINYYTELSKAFDKISQDADFISDYSDFLNNRKIELDLRYLRSRTYFNLLNFVSAFSFFPTFKYNLIEQFLDEINKSNFLEADKIYFKRKVESDFLKDYFHFVIHRGAFEIPDFKNSSGPIKWQTYRASGFDRYFLTFRQKLSTSY